MNTKTVVIIVLSIVVFFLLFLLAKMSLNSQQSITKRNDVVDSSVIAPADTAKGLTPEELQRYYNDTTTKK